jgi:P-loop Domain of unknown function (DUF2791)
MFPSEDMQRAGTVSLIAPPGEKKIAFPWGSVSAWRLRLRQDLHGPPGLAGCPGPNFATSFVVVSDNELKFHRFDDVYRKVVTELGTVSCARGALGDILDRWIGKVEAGLIAAGEDEDAAGFDDKVRKRLDDDLASLTGGQAPQDFVRVIQTIFELEQKGDVAEAGALTSWLCGSGNVASSAKKAAVARGSWMSHRLRCGRSQEGAAIAQFAADKPDPARPGR